MTNRSGLRHADLELRRMYIDRWPRLHAALQPLVEGGRNISEPHLMHFLAHDYGEAAVKLIVIGQQTNGWGEGECRCGALGLAADKYVDSLRATYRQFQLGQYYPSVFWSAAYALYRGLNPRSPAFGFIWTNLFKVDEDGKCASQDVLDVLKEHCDVLEHEIRLANADVVVFLTGPTSTCEGALATALPGLEYEAFTEHPTRELAVIRHPALPARSYRTYHPNHLARGPADEKKWFFLREIVDHAHGH